jgi:hypothetical protein
VVICNPPSNLSASVAPANSVHVIANATDSTGNGGGATNGAQEWREIAASP